MGLGLRSYQGAVCTVIIMATSPEAAAGEAYGHTGIFRVQSTVTFTSKASDILRCRYRKSSPELRVSHSNADGPLRPPPAVRRHESAQR